jgi:hypothetical protein
VKLHLSCVCSLNIVSVIKIKTIINMTLRGKYSHLRIVLLLGLNVVKFRQSHNRDCQYNLFFLSNVTSYNGGKFYRPFGGTHFLPFWCRKSRPYISLFLRFVVLIVVKA